MSTDNYEYEIDLKELFFAALYKWRILFLLAVLGSVLLTGYGLMKKGDSVSTGDTQGIEQYEKKKVSYETTIEKLTTDISNQEKYISESLLMQISPYKEVESSAELLVEVESVGTTNLGNLIKVYEFALRDGDYKKNSQGIGN